MAEAPVTSAADGALYALDPGMTTLRSAALSPTGRLAVTYGVDVLVRTLTIWDLQSQAPLRRIETSLGPMSVRFAEDEPAIVAALLSSEDHSAEVVRWELDGTDDRGEVLYRDKDVAGVAVSRDGRIVVLRGRRSGLRILDLPSGRTSLLGRATPYQKVAVAPRGTLIAATTPRGIDVHQQEPGDPATFSQVTTVVPAGTEPLASMDCSADLIVTASGRSVSVVWPAPDGAAYIAPEPVRRLALTGSGLLAAAHDSAVTLITAATKDVVAEFPAASPVVRLNVSLDDRLLVTAHADGVARVWELPAPPATAGPEPDAPAETAEPDAVRYEREPVGRDFYTLVDTAGYAAYADAIARAIQHAETQPPLTIGIKGAWGAGKTSLMRMVQDRLEWPSGQSPGDGSRLRPIRLTPRGRRRAAVGGKAADHLQVVQNKTVLERLKALHRLPPESGARDDTTDQDAEPDWGAEPGRDPEPEKMVADPRPAPAGPGPDPGDAAWRPTVWFNPWMYQNGEQVWAGLAYEIIKQITERMTVPERESFWLRLNLGRVDERAVRRKIYGLVVDRLLPWAVAALVCVVIGVALLAAPITRWVTVGLAGGAPVLLSAATIVQGISVLRSRVSGSLAQLVQPMGAARQFTDKAVHGAYDELVSSPDYLAKAGFFYFVRADVQRVLNLVATEGRPLVVFVDDLDRCSPGTVVQVIEAINLFLAGEYPNSIFVIAMEPEMVAAHIEAAYSDLVQAMAGAGPAGLGWRFLEKIVQLPLALPAMEAGRKASYITSLFTGSAAAPAAEPTDAQVRQQLDELGGASLEEAVTRSQAAAPEDSAAQAQAIRQIIDLRLTGDSEEVAAVIAFAAPHLAANPREIKRFVNLFRFLVMIDSERGLQGLPSLGSLRAIAKLAVLHLRWPDLLMSLGQATTDGRTVYELLEGTANAAPGAAAITAGSALSKQAAERLAVPGLRTLISSEPPIGEAVRGYL
jgi:hypothetical protein